MSRFISILFVLAVVASACGVDRTSDDVLAEDATVSDESSLPATSGSESDTESTGAETTLAASPPSTAPAGDVAVTARFSDGDVVITHGQLNDVVVPTMENEEFVSLAFSGVRPPSFEIGVLTEQLVSEALRLEIAEVGVEVSPDDIASSREMLLGQVATLYPSVPDPMAEAARLYDEVPYLRFLTDYQAGQEVLTAAMVDGAEPTEGNPCVSHILVETEPEAQAVLDRLAEGEDFAALAVELSTGPSGPGGGELGCAPSGNYVVEFADAVDSAEVGEFVGPVQTEFGYHVLVVNGYEVDGRTLAADRLRERLAGAEVTVDERLGSWDSDRLTIVPADAS